MTPVDELKIPPNKLGSADWLDGFVFGAGYMLKAMSGLAQDQTLRAALEGCLAELRRLNVFSFDQKRRIAEKVQEIPRETEHPELPDGEPISKLKVLCPDCLVTMLDLGEVPGVQVKNEDWHRLACEQCGECYHADMNQGGPSE